MVAYYPSFFNLKKIKDMSYMYLPLLENRKKSNKKKQRWKIYYITLFIRIGLSSLFTLGFVKINLPSGIILKNLVFQ